MTHDIFEIVGTGMMSSYDFIGICECEKERSLEVVGSVVSVCLRWGFAIAIFFLLDFSHSVITVDENSKQSQPKLNKGNTLQQCPHMLCYEFMIRMNEGPRILHLPE